MTLLSLLAVIPLSLLGVCLGVVLVEWWLKRRRRAPCWSIPSPEMVRAMREEAE